MVVKSYFHFLILAAFGAFFACNDSAQPTHVFDPFLEGEVITGDGLGLRVKLSNLDSLTPIYYQWQAAEYVPEGQLYEKAIPVRQSGTLEAWAGYPQRDSAKQLLSYFFNWHKAAGKKIDLYFPPTEGFGSTGGHLLIDGRPGNSDSSDDGSWLGFANNDFQALINLGMPTSFRQVELRYFQNPEIGAMAPKEVIVEGSPDGEDFLEIGRIVPPYYKGKTGKAVVVLRPSTVQYIRVKAPLATEDAWLYIDEIVVR